MKEKGNDVQAGAGRGPAEVEGVPESRVPAGLEADQGRPERGPSGRQNEAAFQLPESHPSLTLPARLTAQADSQMASAARSGCRSAGQVEPLKIRKDQDLPKKMSSNIDKDYRKRHERELSSEMSNL